MKTTTQKQSVAVLGFGLGGHSEDHYTESGASYLSGYDSPENWRPRKHSEYSRTVVIDKREAVKNSPSLAFRSPLLCPKAKGVEKFDLTRVGQIIVATVAERDSTVAACVALHEATPATEIGPFDHAGVPEYTAWWKLHGARIGHVNSKGRIVWENGSIAPRRIEADEMAAQLGLTLQKFYNWGDRWKILRDGQVIRDEVSPYSIRETLMEMGASGMD